eukprot:6074654-Pleurochrysis_carterae.AAC.2
MCACVRECVRACVRHVRAYETCSSSTSCESQQRHRVLPRQVQQKGTKYGLVGRTKAPSGPFRNGLLTPTSEREEGKESSRRGIQSSREKVEADCTVSHLHGGRKRRDRLRPHSSVVAATFNVLVTAATATAATACIAAAAAAMTYTAFTAAVTTAVTTAIAAVAGAGERVKRRRILDASEAMRQRLPVRRVRRDRAELRFKARCVRLNSKIRRRRRGQR